MNDFGRTLRFFAIAIFLLTLTFLITERETAALQHTAATKTVALSGESTIITEMKSGEIAYVSTTAQAVTGEAPLPSSPTPALGGVLLVELPSVQDDKQEGAAVERPTLPNTASDLPVIVLVGALAVAGWVVFRFTHSKPNS